MTRTVNALNDIFRSQRYEATPYKITATWLLLNLNHFASFVFFFSLSLIRFVFPYSLESLHIITRPHVFGRVHKQRHRNKKSHTTNVNVVYVNVVLCCVSAFGSLGLVSSLHSFFFLLFYPFYPAAVQPSNIKFILHQNFFLVLRLLSWPWQQPPFRCF